MNIPTTLPFALLCIVLLTACPTSDPAKDDTAEPADGGTGGAPCEADLEVAQRKLAECRAKLPK